MDDLTQTVLNFINNPENKEKIEKIKETFASTKSTEQEKDISESKEDNSETLQGMPPEALKKLSTIIPLIMSAKKDDKSTKFLSALRPLLNEKRRLKLDESLKIMQMMKLLPMLKDKGIL